MIHFRMTQEQARRKYKCNDNFEGPMPLCGNGNYYLRSSTLINMVTCPKCKEIHASKPEYL